jgi:hypothetical protein
MKISKMIKIAISLSSPMASSVEDSRTSRKAGVARQGRAVRNGD